MSVLSAGQFYGETKARHEVTGIAVSRLEHETARRLPMHVHRQAYFSMVLEGGYREEVGRRAFDYEPMTIVYHPPGTAHLDEIGPRGARFLMIETADDLVQGEDLAAAVRGGYPTELPWPARWKALRLLRSDLDALERETIGLELLGAIGQAESAGSAPSWLAEVVARVQDEFVDPPSSAELALSAGVHPVHLARVVRRETGKTIFQLVRERRIAASIELLSTGESLASIATRTGFADQAHLTRSFRAVTRFTPAELRRLL